MHFYSIVLTITVAVIVQHTKGVTCLKSSSGSQFTFPGENPQPGPAPAPPPPPVNDQNMIGQQLARQLVTGTVPTAAGGTAGVTCICVPTGSCPSPTDGTGQIDIRIVNTPGATITPPATCSTGLVVCCMAGSYQCGVKYPPVAGAVSTTAPQTQFGEYPWQAVILTPAEVYVGSGALISSRHILTAAHKIASLPTSGYKIRLGEWDAASTSEPIPAMEFSVASATIHPSFNSANLQNDVAILTLATTVPLGRTPTIATVCLAAASFTGLRCFVAGWGKNDFGNSGQYQAIQKEVDVPVLSASSCQTALAGTRLGANFVFNPTSFICAGGEAGKDACTGDGGSPLVCQSGNQWYVAGLVAWGIGCAQQGVPGVYVNVASYIPWIQSIIGS